MPRGLSEGMGIEVFMYLKILLGVKKMMKGEIEKYIFPMLWKSHYLGISSQNLFPQTHYFFVRRWMPFFFFPWLDHLKILTKSIPIPHGNFQNKSLEKFVEKKKKGEER